MVVAQAKLECVGGRSRDTCLLETLKLDIWMKVVHDFHATLNKLRVASVSSVAIHCLALYEDSLY